MQKITTILAQIFLLQILIFSGNVFSQSVPYNNPCGNQYFRLAWEDDFSFFDYTRWKKYNDHDQYGQMGPCVSIDDNVSITSSGYLKLDLKKEDYHAPFDQWGHSPYDCYLQKNSTDPSNYYYKFTGGGIKSICGFGVDYGYIEACISFPDEDGSTSCFWTLDTDCDNYGTNAGEIDIVEVWGDNQNNLITNADQYSTNVHLSYDPGVSLGSVDHNIFPPTQITDFNIYGLEWNQNTLKFYFNGILVRTISNNPINNKLDLIFDNWLHGSYFYPLGNWSVNRYNNFSNNSMYVDWIRVYEPHQQLVLAKTPYIINPKDDLNNNGFKQVDIMWQLPSGSSPSTVCTIEWGTSTSYGNTISINDNTTVDHLYSATLNNLTSSTKYYYHIIAGGNIYTGDFIAPPANSSSNLQFYATGAKIPYDGSLLFDYEDISNEILDEISQDASGQTFLIQTNGFVTANNKEFWRDEFFRYSIYTYQLRSKLPILGGITSSERKEKCLDISDQIIGEKSDGNAMNFHTYFPFNFDNPYILNNGDFEYNHSMDYGPVHICFPELEYKNTSASDQAMTFIDNDFGITSKEWKVMSFGFPLKSLNGEILDQYATVLQKAKNNGVQLVLMGSENYYAHWVEDGIHFLILGNGGSTTNGIDDQKIANANKLVQASTVPHFAKFKIDGNMMYVDVIQGADYNGYSKGRVIEKFAIPKNCYITNTQTWNAGTYPIITDYFQIANGGNLKIESEVQLLKDAIVKVYKGAVLNLTGANALLTSVDAFTENLDLVTKDAGGNITNTYKNNYTKQTNFWSGIELKSNPTIDQLNFSNQGVLYVSNGATIKNAKVGVAIKQLMVVNGEDVWKGGGILIADQAHFTNNIIDVEMYPYQGTKTIGSGPINLSDKTRVTRSFFTTDNNFLDLTKSPKHIVLQGVRSVVLYANTFDNTNSSLPETQKGIGIFATESSFNLNNTYYRFQSAQANTFNNLSYGVKTSNVSENGVTYIKGSTFTNCNNSIYLNSSFSTRVLGNTIHVPEFNSAASTAPYGVFIDGGTGFKVENNNIDAPESFSPGTHGIVVNGTGAKVNQIYKNTLTNFNVATQAQDKNFGYDSHGVNIGLSFFCNTYSGDYDVWVAKSNNYSGDIGIAASQQMSVPNQNGGTDDLPAGNEFSNTYRFAAWDYDNGVGNSIDGLYYYYEDNAPYNAEPTYIDNVITIGMSNPNTCPDKSNSGNTPISDLYTKLTGAQISLNSAKLMVNIWKDGGDANLDEEVKTTLPWDVYVQFNSLIAKSPFLSDDVLRETIENPAFTSLMIKLIMVANPQASRNEELMNLIKDRIPALPQSYIDEIMSGEETVSQLDLLENDVASDYHLYRMIGEDIKTNYRNDTINGSAPDSLIAFVSRQSDLLDKYELATIYLNRGLYEDMNNVLTDIPSNFELNEQQSINYTNFVNIFSIAQGMYQNESFTDFLNDEQRSDLETVLYSKGAQVSQMALSLLINDNPDYQYTEEVLEPSEGSERKGSNQKNQDLSHETLFKVYPNPATDYFTLEYQIDANEYSVLQMEIFDASGRKVKTQNLTVSSNALLIDVSMLSKGIYTLSFIADGKGLSVEKLTIVK